MDRILSFRQQQFKRKVMNKTNRDLLVLFKQELLSPQAIEETVDWLHEILQTTERLNNLVVAHEILDLNKYKVIHNPLVLRNTLRKDALKPFIFLNCKN
jgi:hypothetical protein